jgi:hypothetical protein
MQWRGLLLYDPDARSAAMIGLVQTAWLFTRGSQSVRIVRVTRANGPVRLLVNGPGTAVTMYDADDALEGVRYQLHIERGLVAEGYQLASFASAERRSGGDRRGAPRGIDRRRALERVV